MRHALVYVLMNFKKHARTARPLDAMSSAYWFDGWEVHPRTGDPPARQTEEAPVWHPRTWLARSGWRRHGLIEANERPLLP
jgi:putative transposase